MRIDPVDMIFAAMGTSQVIPESSFSDFITSIVSARAISSTRCDEDRILEPDLENPGYLKRFIDGVYVFVPFNIVSVFPGIRKLASVLVALEQIRLSDEGPICISGSTTFLGRDVPISDLDFCEYYFSTDDQFPEFVAKKATLSGNILPIFIKIGDVIHILCADNFQKGNIDFVGLASKWIKLDCIFDDDLLGVISATSVVIPTSSDYKGQSVKNTFVYQEAVVTKNNNIRSLFNRDEMGSYLRFLAKESRKFASYSVQPSKHRYAIKSIKRSISFLLLVGAEEDDALNKALDGTFNLLLDRRVALAALQQREQDLIALREPLRGHRRRKIDIEIGRLRKQIDDSVNLPGLDAFWHRATQEANILATLVEDLIQAAGVDIPPDDASVN